MKWLFRFAWLLLLIWALVFGFRDGSFRAVILPLAIVGILHFLRGYSDKYFPGLKWRLPFVLLAALFAFQSTVWPWLSREFPAIRAEIPWVRRATDRRVASELETKLAQCPPLVVDALLEGLHNLDDSEGRKLKKDLRDLIFQIHLGPLSDSDQNRFVEVLSMKQFTDQRNQILKAIELACPNTKAATPPKPAPTGNLPSVSTSGPNMPVNVNATSTPAAHSSTSGSNAFDSREREPVVAPLRFNRDPSIVPGKINTALVIDAPIGPDGFAPSDALYSLFRAPSTNVVLNLFDEQRFKNSGAFAALYGGDTQPLRDTGALVRVDYLVLAKVLYSFSRSPEIDQDLRSCRLTFSYKTFDRRANLIKADSLTAVAAGLSEVAALKTAIERLAQGHASAILTGQ